MKSKKSLLSLGILALVLVLGVGYAVVSSVGLTLTGTATVADANLKVKISNVVDNKPSAQVVHTTQNLKDEFTITNMTLNETVTMTYTILNEETDVDATLADVQITNSNETYFKVESTIDDADMTHGETGTVTVTVKLIKTPVIAEQGTANITVTLNAKPVNN